MCASALHLLRPCAQRWRLFHSSRSPHSLADAWPRDVECHHASFSERSEDVSTDIDHLVPVLIRKNLELTAQKRTRALFVRRVCAHIGRSARLDRLERGVLL